MCKLRFTRRGSVVVCQHLDTLLMAYSGAWEQILAPFARVAVKAAAAFTALQAVGGIRFIADSSPSGNLGRDRVHEESRGGRYAGDPRIQDQALDRGHP